MTIVRFDCNCKNENDFSTMLNEVHNEGDWGTNFEVGARLWYTLDGLNKAIMVEYQITTKDCKEMVENDSEPDWLVAYEVKNENDNDVSKEIFMVETENNVKLADLENCMLDFAKIVKEKFYSIKE